MTNFLHLFPLLLTTFLFTWLFLAADAAEKENPCDTIARKNNIDGVEQIKCIGRLKAGLLVVTTEMKVWQLDDTSLGQPSMNNTINELYFGDQPPVPIEEKWPKLAQDSRYKKIKGHIPTCRVMIDDEGEWLMLDSTIEQGKNVAGMRWEINRQESAQGVQNIQRDEKTKFLSSNGVAKFYTITTDASGNLQIVQYAACKTGPKSNNTGPGTMVTKWGDSNGDGEVTGKGTCTITSTPDFRPLCKDSDGTSVHVGKVGEKCNFVDWPIFTGFIDDGEFYFFGKDSVVSVPEDAYTKSAPSKFEKIPYDSFIQCKVNPHPRSDPKKKKALVIGLIIALALILLICCLCILLCLVREAMARRKKKDKHGSKSGKGKGGKGGFLGGGTARSGGLLSPLGLSKKISSVSKRSTGGLKPGKKLTGAGGSVRTKRSTTPNKRGGSLTRGPSGGSTRRSKGVGGGGGGGGGPGDGATRRSKGGGSSKGRLTSSGRGPSKAPTGRSKNISGGGRSGSKHSRRPSGGRSNKATERSKLKNR